MIGTVGIMFHLFLAENLVLGFGLGINEVFHREIRRYEGWKLTGQAFVLLAVSNLGFLVVYHGILVPLGLTALFVPAALLWMTGLGHLNSVAAERTPAFFLWGRTEFGSFWASPTAFGFLVIIIEFGWNFTQTIAATAAGSLGLGLMYALIRTIRLNARLSNLPKTLAGEPVLFIALGLLSLGFSLLDRLVYAVLV